jgi:adenylate kinase family enzyme
LHKPRRSELFGGIKGVTPATSNPLEIARLPSRVAIIGISGSGKSVFSRHLAESLSLPLLHMDQLFWRGSWEAVPESEYLARHKEWIARERWIIEGYVDESMSDRLTAADLVIYLDYSGPLCAWRVFRRWLMHRRTGRPELPNEALERLSPRFVLMTLRRGERPGIEQALAKAGCTSIRLNSPRDTEAFLLQAKSQANAMLANSRNAPERT